MLKIDIYADRASYKVGGSTRPILRPSQFFGILNDAIHGYDKFKITEAQASDSPIDKDICEQHKKTFEIFSKLIMFVSVTKSAGSEFEDYCTVDTKKWDGTHIKLHNSKDQSKPIAPFNKKYTTNVHHIVYLDGDMDALISIVKALEAPQAFLCVGRKNCPISEIRVSEINDATQELNNGFYCAGSRNKNHFELLGIECDSPNHFKQPVWPHEQIGKHMVIDWYEVDGQTNAPNYRLGKQSGDFVYIIDKCTSREWAHNVVYKYFGSTPWYIDKGNKVIIFSRQKINGFDKFLINPKRSVQCHLSYVPKCYSMKEKNTGPRQNMTAGRHQKLEIRLGIKLKNPTKILVDGKNMKLDAYKYEFELGPAQFKKLVFNKYGKGQGRGYGAIEPDNINDIIW